MVESMRECSTHVRIIRLWHFRDMAVAATLPLCEPFLFGLRLHRCVVTWVNSNVGDVDQTKGRPERGHAKTRPLHDPLRCCACHLHRALRSTTARSH